MAGDITALPADAPAGAERRVPKNDDFVLHAYKTELVDARLSQATLSELKPDTSYIVEVRDDFCSQTYLTK